jgi:RimJ/RimL family protein N-acetyltransferase
MGYPPDSLSACVLEGQWGSLRPLNAERDGSRLYTLTHGAEAAATWQEMKVGPFADEAAFIAHAADLTADPKRAFFAIAGPDGHALGWLCLMEASNSHKSVELGYVLYSPMMQRTALATEAFFLIMTHVFDTLGFQRLEWTCTASNVRSYHAAARLGLQLEGVMRSKLWLKGTPRDIAMFSLLADEWPARCDAMRAWLDPANFDQGRQKSALRMRADLGNR